MEIREVECKTALSSSSLPGLDYSLNPYRGCQHNCAYCYVPNVLRIHRNKWGDFVDVRINISSVLSKELRNKKPGVVGISTVTDPYQSIEKKYKLTRYCLEQLLIHDFPICIQTKSKLVVRDIDIISKFSNAEVMISIGTLKDDQRKLLEPNTSSIDERLKALKIYSDIGIKTSIFFGPIYPTTKIDDLPGVIDTFKEYGASAVMIDKLNLKPGIWQNIESKLQCNSSVFETFSRNLFKTKEYYSRIQEQVKKLGREKKIEIVDAF
jgi:DNA repair photolyase